MQPLNKICRLSIVIIITSIFQPANSQVITTIAGGGIGDGNAATSAALKNPEKLAIDASGNIYIADGLNNRIRKVNANGIITTVAGNGNASFSGDGGPAKAAGLNNPAGVAIDANGNIYIADTYNHRIRKVNKNGIISTIAGNGTPGYTGDGVAATATELSFPQQVAVDATGNLYISDFSNQRIRRVGKNGIISTVAGNGGYGNSGNGGLATNAAIDSPGDLALDASGNMYITEPYEGYVRKITAAGIISTIAGTGPSYSYGGDGGAATAAALNVPWGVTVDATGNVYIADASNQRIRKINTTGIISTVAGGGSSGLGDGGQATTAMLHLPTGVALDAAGNIYIVDENDNRIRKVTSGGVITTFAGGWVGDGGPATTAALFHPAGVATDALGNVYIADANYSRVRKVSTSGIITTIAGTGEQGYSGEGGQATAAELNYPYAVAVDGQGNVYIADVGNNRIRKVATNGVISTFAGTGVQGYGGDGNAATTAKFSGPYGIAIDVAGNVYIADLGNERVRKVGINGIINTIAGNGTQGYSGDGGAATAAQLLSPGGIAVDAVGNVYITDQGNSRIRKVGTNGTISTIAGNGTQGYSGDGAAATDAEINIPASISVDAAGRVFIVDLYNQRIRKVGTNGIITTITGTGTLGYSGDGGPAVLAQIYSPTGVTTDAAGNVYIADNHNDRIRKITAGALPVTILNFDGQLTHSDAILNWQTATEVNTAYFNVQRSVSGQKFTTVGKVTAAGNATVTQNYTFKDELATISPSPVLLYYRLQEVDKDGNANYSRTIKLSPGEERLSVKTYPNPVQNTLMIQLKGITGFVAISIISADGKTLLKKTLKTLDGDDVVNLNIASLASGTYIVNIAYASKNIVQKFVKQ